MNKDKQFWTWVLGDGKGKIKPVIYCPKCKKAYLHNFVAGVVGDLSIIRQDWECTNCGDIHE